jgi:hypothetical protein
MFIYDSFVLFYAIKFLGIVDTLHNVGNGNKTTSISSDVVRWKGGELHSQTNIELTWKVSLQQLHYCKHSKPLNVARK